MNKQRNPIHFVYEGIIYAGFIHNKIDYAIIIADILYPKYGMCLVYLLKDIYEIEEFE